MGSTVFAELIEKVLGEFNKDKVGYFIDDVILETHSTKRVASQLQEMLQTLIQHNLTIEPNKMQVCKNEIDCLGFKIN